MAVAENPQLATDERLIEASALEAALEERESRRASLGGVRKAFKESDDKAKALLAEFSLQDGEVARCGRFRIAKKAYAGHAVAFETSPSSRILISADQLQATIEE